MVRGHRQQFIRGDVLDPVPNNEVVKCIDEANYLIIFIDGSPNWKEQLKTTKIHPFIKETWFSQ